MLAANKWLTPVGGGVDVKSNYPDQGSGTSCSGEDDYIKVAKAPVDTGAQWQCTELINRLYLTKGWIAQPWGGNGDQLYANRATVGLSGDPQGSIGFVAPGDVVSVDEYNNGVLQPAGHALVVDTTGPVTSGTVPLVSQNFGTMNPYLPIVTTQSTLANGTLTMGAAGSPWTYQVLGVVHAPTSTKKAALVFDGSPGTSAPPSSLGPFTMTTFGADSQSDGAQVSTVAGPTGNVAFAPTLVHLIAGLDWNTWSNGYGGDVYADESGSTLLIMLPAGTKAFYFYAEPNVYATFTISATAQDGTSSGPVSVYGQAGATYFGFYTSAPHQLTLSSITVTINDPFASGGFAVGEFGISG